MRQFGLIGWPLGHSFSKAFFAEKFSREGITDTSYELYPLSDIKSLPGLIESTPGLQGLNVTIPHKTAVTQFLTSADSEAEKVGAFNVLKISGSTASPVIKGFNTDIYGLELSLKEFTEGNVKNALVLGTGGSSLAVKYVLEKIGIEYINVSRNEAPGILTYSTLPASVVAGSRLIINTTPLGMYPDTGSCPDIDYNMIGENHFLFDLVYNPRKTLFLEQGEKRGAKVMNGLRMLHLQAERSWEIWNDPSF